MFIRRLGEPALKKCEFGRDCPQVLVMTDGSFAVVGVDIKSEASGHLPPGPGVGPNEGMVKVPREVMVGIIPDLLKIAQ